MGDTLRGDKGKMNMIKTKMYEISPKLIKYKKVKANSKLGIIKNKHIQNLKQKQLPKV